MGRGDKRTRKGKICRGTFGNSRPQKRTTTEEPQTKAKSTKKK